MAGFLLLLGTIFLGYRRYHVPAEQEELMHYFKKTFPQLHAQTKSLQSALVSLVGNEAPAADKAVVLLDENVIPSIDLVLEQARAARLETIPARALHTGYLEELGKMREDAVALRATFADPGLDLAEKRRRTQERIAAMGVRFDTFYEKAAAIWRENGIEVAPPKHVP